MKTKIALILSVLLVASLTWMGLEGNRRFHAPGPLTESISMVIPRGAGTELIAKRLEAAGVIPDRYSFMVGAKLSQANLKAGEYEFTTHISPVEAVRLMAEGHTVIHKLTVAEGLTAKRALALVREAEYLVGEIVRKPLEGTLMPDTWNLSRDELRDDVVARMEKSMRQFLDQAWAARDRNTPLKNKDELLVLASIIERETALVSERPKVAAVFVNRLRKGMKLQSDPTVIYGLSDGLGVLDRTLTRADLENGHRWNTYVIPALPPTPIANPGRASIEAALHPAASEALYFVADGTGGHVFAKTLDEHNKNVAAWRKVERDRGLR